jgi:hypothetical protein
MMKLVSILWQPLSILSIVMLMLGTTGKLALHVEPVLTQTSGLTRAQQERLEEVASASLFGQFRSSMADFLWLKADKYLHNGVDMRGLTPLEREGLVKADRAGHAKGETASGEREHTAETTAVPAAHLDWRGPFGDLEREVKPFTDMRHHTHRDPKEALPLFRLMVISNPHFIPGYTCGAAMIAGQRGHYREAFDFLKEGERNNPESIEIQTQLGYMLTGKERKFDEALPYLQRALALGAARDSKTLTEDERDGYRDAFRWIVLNRREAGDAKAAQSWATAGLRLFPNDVVCRNYLERKEVHTPEDHGLE